MPYSSDSRLTYRAFDNDTLDQFLSNMRNYQASVHGEPMRQIWENLRDSYLPLPVSELLTRSRYTLDTDGNASPNGFIAPDNSISDLNLNRTPHPLVAIKLHTGLSILTQKTPDVIWDSESPSYDENAPILNALRQQEWDLEETRAQFTNLIFNDMLYGSAFWRRFYEYEERTVNFVTEINPATKKAKYKKEVLVEKDNTGAEALTPLEVLIDPATKPQTPSSTRYIAYEKVMDFERFKQIFQSVNTRPDFNEVKPTSVQGFTGDNYVKLTYFEHKDLDLYAIQANDKHLIVKSHIPANHKDLSAKLVTWMPRGQNNPFGLGPMEMMSSSREQLEAFSAMTFNQTQFSIYKAAFYSGAITIDGQDANEFIISPGKLYKASNPKDITFYDIPGPGRDAWESLDILRQKADEASGINAPLAGQITKSTAYEIDLAKDAALARLGVPIASIVNTLVWDAEIIFLLQKQFYSIPKLKELLTPEEILAAHEELMKLRSSPYNSEAKEPLTFDLIIDDTTPDDPKVYKAEYRTAQIALNKTSNNELTSSLGKQQVVLTPKVFNWKGQFRIVTDTLLSITPTLERSKRLEGFNILIPMFRQPPQIMAKPARSLAKLYAIDVNDTFPDDWIQFLKASDSGQLPPTLQPPQFPPGRPKNIDVNPEGFTQERAERVTTSVNGQNSQAASRSQTINQQ